jgi:hypothetical protein
MIKQLDLFDIAAVSKCIDKQQLEQFTEMFLSGLSSWRSYGNIDNNTITSMICIYVSKDSPEFFILSDYGTDLLPIINFIVEELEPRGYIRFLRRQDCDQEDYFQVDDRYEYTTDYIVPAKTKCLFSKHWYILYDSTLAEKDTAVKTAVLKKEYRVCPRVGNI